MRRLVGQVGRHSWRRAVQAVSFVLRLAMLAAILIGVGLAALGWRLAQGPLAIPSITAVNNAVAARLTGMAPGVRITYGQAWVAWEGWKDGRPAPLQLRLDALRVADLEGATRASLASVEVTLAAAPLLHGVVAPERVLLRDPFVSLRRDMAGDLALDLGVPPAVPEAPPSDGAQSLEAGTQALARALRGPASDSPLASLQEVRIESGLVQVRDDPLRFNWSLDEVGLSLTRGADGALGIAGSGALLVAGQQIPVRIVGRAAGEPPVAEAALEIDALSPAALAAALPSLKPLSVLEADLGARLSGRYDFGDGRFTGRAEVRAEGGQVVAPDRRVPFQAARLVLTNDGTHLGLERLELTLPARGPAGRPTRISATASADRREDRWHGQAELTVDWLAVADLDRYWPADLAVNVRSWLVENLTAGVARDGRWVVKGEMGSGLSDPRVTEVNGTLRAEGVTVHWLRPVPPIEGADGLITFSLGEVVVQARANRQSGTGLSLPEARVRLFDLDVDAEKAEITGRVTGPLADVLTVIRHPRLHLFDKRPLELGAAGGMVDARLTLTTPLKKDLRTEEIAVSATGKVMNGRIADFIRGQPVERADLDVQVDLAGMRLAGNAQLGTIPGRLEAQLDFRPGPPSQVTERVRVEGRAEAADLRRLGVEAAPYATGPMGYVVGVERHRSREAEVAVRADLRDTRLALSPFLYSKAPGVAARAEGTLRFRGDELVALEGVRIEGPQLDVRGGVAFGRGDAYSADVLEARVGASRLVGRFASPTGPGDPWDIRVRGTVLDARGLLRERAASSSGRGGGETAMRVDAVFDRVLLNEGRELAPVQAALFVDARGVLRELRASGRGVRGGGFEAVVVPRGAGRAMEVRASGFGTLLRDLGLFEAVDDGAFHASGEWPSNAPGAPLTGVAELRDFGVREAASIGKLLQALSIYGIPEAARGPGLRFTVASAPYTLTPQALTLREARAVSASLGVTVEGRILREAERYDLRGTIIPSYALNSALGRIPGIGQLFTAERNGGIFAANFRMTGKLDDPDFRLDPLSMLAPGALRRLFGGD
ncbi:DUF3971 domain-containing protein [Roseomonas sp. KE2513]|uniref:YhdP family protein n=1 Tax=Roseomonas sp. KE2513 TaxID=2479202 RepID=UPI0018DF4D47|nr:DUF3971 domain-containing protein [Roseomonas sp. KE2513]